MHREQKKRHRNSEWEKMRVYATPKRWNESKNTEWAAITEWEIEWKMLRSASQRSLLSMVQPEWHTVLCRFLEAIPWTFLKLSRFLFQLDFFNLIQSRTSNFLNFFIIRPCLCAWTAYISIMRMNSEGINTASLLLGLPFSETLLLWSVCLSMYAVHSLTHAYMCAGTSVCCRADNVCLYDCMPYYQYV